MRMLIWKRIRMIAAGSCACIVIGSSLWLEGGTEVYGAESSVIESVSVTFKSSYGEAQEIMEPEISKIVGEATEKVRKETEERVQKETEKRVQKETEERVQKETEKRQAVDTAKKMISSGKFSAKEIIKYVSGISIEEVMTLEKELAHTRSI